MYNPYSQLFTAVDWEDLTDDPNGQRIILSCATCGQRTYQARYSPSKQLLIWTCPDGHNNTQKINLNDE